MLIRDQIVRSNRLHVCEACHNPIKPGMRYRRVITKENGDFVYRGYHEHPEEQCYAETKRKAESANVSWKDRDDKLRYLWQPCLLVPSY